MDPPGATIMTDRDQLNEITNTLAQEAAAVVVERPPSNHYGPLHSMVLQAAATDAKQAIAINAGFCLLHDLLEGPTDDHGLKRRVPDSETEVASLDAWNAPDSRKKQVLGSTYDAPGAYNQHTQQQWGAGTAGAHASSPSPANAYMVNPPAAQSAPTHGTYNNSSSYVTQPPGYYNSNAVIQNSNVYGSSNGTSFPPGGFSSGTPSLDGNNYRGMYASTSNPYSPANGINGHGVAADYNTGPPAPPAGMYGSADSNGFAPGEQGDAPPLPPRNCLCGIPCPPRVSQSAANTGRTFFACTKPRDDQTRCRFFEWADGMNSMGAMARAGDNAADRTHLSNTPGAGVGAAAGGACFTCGQSGHWSRDCPNRANTVGGGVGGGTYRPGGGAGGGGAAAGGGGGGGGTCFSCGESGHWSRDCPRKGTNNSYSTGSGQGSSYGRGGGYGSSYGSSYGGGRGGAAAAGGWNGSGKNMNCYKCGQPGHFSSSCPNSNAL